MKLAPWLVLVGSLALSVLLAAPALAGPAAPEDPSPAIQNCSPTASALSPPSWQAQGHQIVCGTCGEPQCSGDRLGAACLLSNGSVGFCDLYAGGGGSSCSTGGVRCKCSSGSPP